MFKEQKRHTIDVLFVITLFAVFAISVITLTGVGAKVYQNVVNKMDDNFNARTSFSYVYNKVHQSDTEGNIAVGTYCGINSLIISEEIDNISYSTYLYSYDGKLKELFVRTGQEFDPAYGTDILNVDSFEISYVTDSMLKFTITPAGNDSETIFIHIRSAN